MVHVNIVGYGYVGSSLGYVCKQNNVAFTVTDVQFKDEPSAQKVYTNIVDTILYSESVNDWNAYFVCVPTPSKPDGECNTEIVESVVKNIRENAIGKTAVFVKSTVQPRTCRKLYEQYHSDTFNVCFVPEFLTEKRANLDMYEAKFALIGTHDGTPVPEYTELFKQLYVHNPELEVITKKFEVCELFKYTVNCFLATKVWFFNEIHELSDKLDFEYNELRDILRLDPRIGDSHTRVPGHDGKFSFSGSCFPKDCNSLRYTQHIEGLSDSGMSVIINRSDELRKKPVIKLD